MSNNPGVSACCDDGTVHIRIDGRAVAHDCPALRQYVETALEDGCRKVFVHLDQCEHFDSTFLGTLLCLRRFAEGADPIELQLVNTSEAAATIIRRMGAASLFQSCSGDVPSGDAQWSTCESEQAGNCSREFKQNVVQAHQQLAEVDGPLGATYRQVAEMAAQDLKQRRISDQSSQVPAVFVAREIPHSSVRDSVPIQWWPATSRTVDDSTTEYYESNFVYTAGTTSCHLPVNHCLMPDPQVTMRQITRTCAGANDNAPFDTDARSLHSSTLDLSTLNSCRCMPESPTESDKLKRTPNLSRMILGGLAAGIACGLFFGEYCSLLAVVGQAFVDLLQMTVLPYLAVSLVAGVGRLSLREFRQLALTGGAVLLMLWVVGALLIVGLPLALPDSDVGAFFSTAIIERPEPPSLFSQFIPANPFHALANGIVPAVVLFGIFAGLSVSGLPGKEPVLDMLDFLVQVLMRINSVVIRLTPVGVFAIAANLAGTTRPEEFVRLQGYVLTMTAAAAILTFWLLPMLIAVLTPFSYRDVANASRAALITAFATGKVLLVLPFIVEATNDLLKTADIDDAESRSSVEAVIPLAYPFPHLGRLMSLLFIPFAAWYVDDSMELAEYPAFLAAGLPAMFGGPVLGIPYLLDARQLPADLFQLFLATGPILGRLGDILGAMHLFAVSILTICATRKLLRFRPRAIMGLAAGTCLITGLAIAGTHSYLRMVLPDMEHREDVLGRMQTLMTSGNTVVHRSPPETVPSVESWESRLERIRETQTLRVGYHPRNFPYTFFNSANELVGFDIDMAQLLANELDCRVEFVPFEFNTLAEQLHRGDFDIAMSGIGITPTRLLEMSFSEPYLETTLAFLVRDHLRREFSSAEELQQLSGLRIAVARSDYFRRKIQAYLPDAEVIPIDSPEEFFERDDLDGLLIGAEAGSAWTLAYPGYAVAVPHPDIVSQPIAYAVPDGDIRLSEFLSRWIAMKRHGLEYQRLYDHWILGQDPQAEEPRWSILRDVLHWVD